MANVLITPQTIARRALATLYNTAVLAGLVFRDYDPDFSGKQGDTVTVRTPAVFEAKDFSRPTGIQLQDVREGRFPVKLDRLSDVSFPITAEELTLQIDEFSERILAPAMEAHVQKIDDALASELLAMAVNGGDSLGPVTADAATDVITVADHGFYNGDKVVFTALTGGAGIGTAAVRYVRDATKNTFKVSTTDGGAAVDVTSNATAGTVVRAGGGSVAQVGGQPAPNALIDARTRLTANKMPTAERYGVVSPEQAGDLLKDPLFHQAGMRGDTDGLREATVGRKFGFDTFESQVYSGLTEGVAFHRTAVALVTRTLDLPMGASSDTAAVESYKGLGLRVVKDYDINQKQDVISIDLLFGIKRLRPGGAVALDLSAS